MKHARRMMVCQIGRGSSPPPDDLLIDDCETLWTATTGLLRAVNATPTAGGSGYTAGDILDVTTGGAGGKVQVSTVDGGGAVTAVAHYAGGYGGYTTGTGKATSGGTGTGCTVNITTITNASFSLATSPVHDGAGAMRVTMSSSANAALRSLLGYRAVSPPSLEAYSRLKTWVYLDDTTPDIATGELEICLCSDTVGRVVVDRFVVTGPATQIWTEQIATRVGSGTLGASIQSIALYRGSVTHVAGISAILLDNIRVSA